MGDPSAHTNNHPESQPVIHHLANFFNKNFLFKKIILSQLRYTTQGDKEAGLQDSDVHKVNFTKLTWRFT